MHPIPLSHRLAAPEDCAAISGLMALAIAELQKPFLSPAQIAASRKIMGLDRQLIQDQTYFLIESGGALVGCGGWSFRQTLYGSDDTPGRSAQELDPATQPARVRAMYTHPLHTRKGIARWMLRLCEDAARRNGFQAAELMATLAGEPLYLAQGYAPLERVENDVDGVAVPLIRMRKSLV